MLPGFRGNSNSPSPSIPQPDEQLWAKRSRKSETLFEKGSGLFGSRVKRPVISGDNLVVTIHIFTILMALLAKSPDPQATRNLQQLQTQTPRPSFELRKEAVLLPPEELLRYGDLSAYCDNLGNWSHKCKLLNPKPYMRTLNPT